MCQKTYRVNEVELNVFLLWEHSICNINGRQHAFSSCAVFKFPNTWISPYLQDGVVCCDHPILKNKTTNIFACRVEMWCISSRGHTCVCACSGKGQHNKLRDDHLWADYMLRCLLGLALAKTKAKQSQSSSKCIWCLSSHSQLAAHFSNPLLLSRVMGMQCVRRGCCLRGATSSPTASIYQGSVKWT